MRQSTLAILMTSVFALTAFFAGLGQALAHGEDKPGPHGGHIRMPGGFHTEVVVKPGGAALVYLLDAQFANPTVQGSQVQATWKKSGSDVPLTCAAKADHFECKKPGADLKAGTLVLKANRAGAPGNEATYELPLRFGKSAGHQHH